MGSTVCVCAQVWFPITARVTHHLSSAVDVTLLLCSAPSVCEGRGGGVIKKTALGGKGDTGKSLRFCLQQTRGERGRTVTNVWGLCLSLRVCLACLSVCSRVCLCQVSCCVLGAAHRWYFPKTFEQTRQPQTCRPTGMMRSSLLANRKQTGRCILTFVCECWRDTWLCNVTQNSDYFYLCVCVCVCVCARLCVHACTLPCGLKCVWPPFTA